MHTQPTAAEQQMLRRVYRSAIKRARCGLSHGDRVRALKTASQCRNKLTGNVTVADYDYSFTTDVMGSPARILTPAERRAWAGRKGGQA